MKNYHFLLTMFLLASCAQVPAIAATQTLDTIPPSPMNQNISPIETALTSANFDISGRILVYTPDAVYLANSDGSSPALIHTIESPLPMMSLSPDGTKFAYFSGNSLYVKNIITGQVSTLNQEAISSIGGQLKWSPDSKKIALACSTTNELTTSICLVDLSGNIESLIKEEDIADKESRLGYFLELQDWSRDGSKLVFTHYTPSEKGQKQHFSIYSYDIVSKTTQLILDSKKQEVILQIRGASISPDNNTLLISGIDENSLFQIFVLNIDTGDLSQFHPILNASLTNPVWSGDSCCFYVHVEQDNLPEHTAIANLTGNIMRAVNIQGFVIQWVR